MSQHHDSNAAHEDESGRRLARYGAFLNILSTVGGALVIAVLTALLGIFQQGLGAWWHSFAREWLLISLAILGLLIIGFAGGVLYALHIGVFLTMTMFNALMKGPKLKRGWWWTPLDWVAIAVFSSAFWAFGFIMIVEEKAKQALRRSPKTSASDDQNENERLRVENEQLHAEVESLKRQLPHQDETPLP